MNREILLVEPNYRNKYPPMGLMKISTYYKKLGDHVRFFKGDLKDLVIEDIYEELIKKLYANYADVFWEYYKPNLVEYIKKGTSAQLKKIPYALDDVIIKALLQYYRKFYKDQLYFKPEYRKYDRVGITTLFTFYWDITIDTINFVKQLCKTEDGVMIGGVMASILPDRVEKATGIRPHVGTLETPGELDAGNDMIIDLLPLDYSILEEIDYQYPASNAYFAYMTRGCINHCSFCAVPKLEPVYKEFLPVYEQVKIAEERFGAKRDLLLLDNNVLASRQYNDIIDDIKKAGFRKGDTYTPPNLYEIAVRNLKDGINDRGYLKACVKQFRLLLERKNLGDLTSIRELLEENFLLEDYTATKDAVLETYEELSPLFAKIYTGKTVRKRYVDFNQGIDSRLITQENMQKLAEISVEPVRIAFDHWELKDVYVEAVKTAVSCGHHHLSNYILYNFKDKPLELYWRLKLNVELCEELGVTIYSFPMKYHPIDNPDFFSNRDYIGDKWSRKTIRTIQAILNSTKGKIGRGKEFFYKAFGRTDEEFEKLLYMPEPMIIYRFYFEGTGQTDDWWRDYSALSEDKRAILKEIVDKNIFTDIESLTDDQDILRVLTYYQITRDDAEAAMSMDTESDDSDVLERGMQLEE